MANHDNSNPSIREIQVSRDPRAENGNDRMPEGLKNLFSLR
jgi:hypothetical protein